MKNGTIRSISVDKNASGDINNQPGKVNLQDITNELNEQDRDFHHEPEAVSYYNSEIHITFKAIPIRQDSKFKF